MLAYECWNLSEMVSMAVRNIIMEMSMDDRTISTLPPPFHSSKVPVFHIFGCLPTGEKACLHVHGVLPYFVVRVGGSSTDDVKRTIRHKINQFIKEALEREMTGKETEQKKLPDRDYVVRIEVVCGRSMYGYHPSEERFARVYFTSPFYAGKAAAAMSSSDNVHMQPFEAHIPISLQFSIDNSIFGMDYVNVRSALFRFNRDRNKEEVVFNSMTVSQLMSDKSLLSPLAPQTSSHIEVDVKVDDIINQELHRTNVYSSNPGLEFLWNYEAARNANEELIDTFSKCCEERRASTHFELEKEFFKKLRKIARDLHSMKEKKIGNGLTQGLNDTVNASTNETSESNTNIWAAKEKETTVLKVETIGEEAQIYVDEDAIDLASSSMTASEEPEEWMWEGKEEEEEEMDDNMDKTVLEIERMAVQRQIEHIGASTARKVSEEEKKKATRKKKEEEREESGRRKGLTSKIAWRTLVRKLPYLACDGRRGLSVNIDTTITRDNVKQAKKSDAKSFYNLFESTSACKETTTTESEEESREFETGITAETRYLSVLSLELATLTVDRMPCPLYDPISTVSLSFYSDICVSTKADAHLVLIVSDALPYAYDSSQSSSRPRATQIYAVSTEEDIIETVIRFVERCDPDLLIGYEKERLSWGYLIERAARIGIEAVKRMARIEGRPDYTSVTVTGRLLISVWRIVRRELTLRSYDRSTATQNVLHKRIATIDQRSLGKMYQEEVKRSRLLLCDYLLRLSMNNIDLLSAINFFSITSEMARVYGIQFEEVLTRGSQFRVESMLLRFARRLRFFAPTITPDKRNKMCAPEQLQLVMEPQSGIYYDPVIVLDFQSLYPSMAIAYNYCFSTCLGKTSHLSSLTEEGYGLDIELGALQYRVPTNELVSLTSSKELHVSPLGSVFVKYGTEEGIVPKMLREILAARFMVKQAMKATKNKRLSRILDARQLALKLVANVTYGYTAANWSGRMPCVEVADAILAKGRETLERAVELVRNGGDKYMKARVIYGDTDSLFVLVKGATIDEAFKVGRLIVDDVTADNPAPVVLKLEKVYKGCILQTKKRYAGMAYESEEDMVEEGGKGPVYDAKGIETVRRDTCPVVAKVLEKCLRLLLSRNISGLKLYLNRKLSSLEGLPYTDFIFCKEYRGDYSPLAHVPQAKIAECGSFEEWESVCPRAMPLVGQRVPYVIVQGTEISTVYSCVRSLDHFVRRPLHSIYFSYYVHSHILAALHRCFLLIPMQILWLPYPVTSCVVPGCHTDSAALRLCGFCEENLLTETMVELENARLNRVSRECVKTCISCMKIASPSIESCTSFSCRIRTLRVMTSRQLERLKDRPVEEDEEEQEGNRYYDSLSDDNSNLSVE